MSTNKSKRNSSSRANARDPAAAAASFGQRLREVRSAKGRTLRDVALNAKVSIAYLSDLERGKLSNPTLDKLRQIADELGVSVDDLLGTRDEVAMGPRGPGRSSALQALARSAPFREAVQEQAVRLGRPARELTDEWLDALAGIQVAGQRPRDASDYLFIFEASRRAVGPAESA